MTQESTPSCGTFDSAARDRAYWSTIDEIVASRGYRLEDMLRNWPAYIMRRDLPRFLSHYELFKQVVDLPGCIVELGVYRGASFFTWSILMESFCPYDRSRKVFGFDSFEGLQDFTHRDGKLDTAVQKSIGGYKATAEEVRNLVGMHNSDNMIPGTKRCQLVVGRLEHSIPSFLEQNPGLKIALLHFDVDLYEPTKIGLEMLYPLVLKGGVVCFDEYGLVPWQGETQAADEYFEKLGLAPKILKHSFAQTPHGYFIK
jgi:hypothetical protein